MYLGVIPARGGSKGIPGKNTLVLAGKPTIQWTFDAAKAASLLDKVICSTDCNVAKSLAEENSIEVHDRASRHATDTTPIVDVLLELAIEYSGFTHFVLLQPTSPCRSSSSIDNCIRVSKESGCDTVITGYRNEHFHPSLLFQLNEVGSPKWLLEKEISTRRQDQREFFTRSGVCYVIRVESLLEQHSIYGMDVRSVILNANECINLDEPRDLIMAEHFLLADHGRY